MIERERQVVLANIALGIFVVLSDSHSIIIHETQEISVFAMLCAFDGIGMVAVTVTTVIVLVTVTNGGNFDDVPF